MHKIKEMFMNEIYEYEDKAKTMSGGTFSPQEVQYIHILTDTVKNIDKIEMLEDDGYSQDGGHWTAKGTYGDGMRYDDDVSYARGRGRSAKRDSMGRYSKDSMPYDHRRDGRKMRDGYSGHSAKEYMIEELEEMMENANTEKERQAIKHCIQQIENA